MSAAPSIVSKPASLADVVVLQHANPTRTAVVPVGVLVGVIVVMVAVTIGIVRAGGDAADTDYNGAVLWSIVGFIVGLGAQSVVASFPLALALGSTRRTFVLGTQTAALLQSALLTGAALLLLGLELTTGGWFVGARVLSDSTLGGGNAFVLVTTMFLTALTALSVGGVFGASWVRAGAKGPLVLGVAVVVVVLGALLILLPTVAAVARSFETWWLVVAALIVVAASTTGQYGMLRRASVR